MQYFTSDHLMFVLMTFLYVYYDVENRFFLHAVGYVCPFFYACKNLMDFLPCPTMAAVVCNSTLLILFAVISLGAYLLSANIFTTFIYIMAVWPWFVILAMLARIYVGQKRRQFHPFKHLPWIALMGSFSVLFFIRSVTLLSITDAIVLTSVVDPWLTAVVGLI